MLEFDKTFQHGRYFLTYCNQFKISIFFENLQRNFIIESGNNKTKIVSSVTFLMINKSLAICKASYLGFC